MTPIGIPHSINQVVEQLSQYESYKDLMHQCQGIAPLPSELVLKEIVALTRSILFPGFFGTTHLDSRTLSYHLGVAVDQLYKLLHEQIVAGLCYHTPLSCTQELQAKTKQAQDITTQFIQQLPEIRRVLSTDVLAAYNGDPAAYSAGEVILCYPAIRSITNHRMAHALLRLGVPLIPRMLSEMAHSETGIDIHPGASIGESFTIDHGTGVVIGETAIIGSHVKIYQGVTLGAKSFPLDDQNNPIKGIARHPIIEDHVVIYSNATILGRITVGAGATIGGNIWVTENVPAGVIIAQNKAKI